MIPASRSSSSMIRIRMQKVSTGNAATRQHTPMPRGLGAASVCVGKGNEGLGSGKGDPAAVLSAGGAEGADADDEGDGLDGEGEQPHRLGELRP